MLGTIALTSKDSLHCSLPLRNTIAHAASLGTTILARRWQSGQRGDDKAMKAMWDEGSGARATKGRCNCCNRYACCKHRGKLQTAYFENTWHKLLHPSQTYVIMIKEGSIDRTEHRKEPVRDRHARKIPYSRADCRIIASLGRYHYAPPEREDTQRYQSQRQMARPGKCIRGILRETDQHPRRSERRLKIKPAECWQVKSNNLAALRLPPKVLANARDNPRNLHATDTMIPDLAKKSKILCIETWACDRKIRMPMKRKFDPFSFKVIETKYNGYLMRSRLEARWGTFFDYLSINYYYEYEGFELEGQRYLPDFWLPQQDCFIEVKGKEPTEDEKNKAKLLSLYTGKNVHIFYGEIKLPDTRNNSISYIAPKQWKCLSSEMIGGNSTQLVHTPPDLLALKQKMEDCFLQMDTGEENGDATVIFMHNSYSWDIGEIPEYLDTLQKQQYILPVFQSFAQTRKDEIIDMLIPEEGWDYEFCEQRELTGFAWIECPECKGLDIHYMHSWNHVCKDGKERIFVHNTPGLIAAYEAARQARF